jgi:hypothetical protein
VKIGQQLSFPTVAEKNDRGREMYQNDSEAITKAIADLG